MKKSEMDGKRYFRVNLQCTIRNKFTGVCTFPQFLLPFYTVDDAYPSMVELLVLGNTILEQKNTLITRALPGDGKDGIVKGSCVVLDVTEMPESKYFTFFGRAAKETM